MSDAQTLPLVPAAAASRELDAQFDRLLVEEYTRAIRGSTPVATTLREDACPTRPVGGRDRKPWSHSATCPCAVCASSGTDRQ